MQSLYMQSTTTAKIYATICNKIHAINNNNNKKTSPTATIWKKYIQPTTAEDQHQAIEPPQTQLQKRCKNMTEIDHQVNPIQPQK